MKETLISLNISERVQLPPYKWVETTVLELDARQEKKLWQLYSISYEKFGMHLKDISSMLREYSFLRLLDTNEDEQINAFLAFKKTPFGNKLAVLGTDGSARAKSAAVKEQLRLMKQKGWYAESSGRIAAILELNGIESVNDPILVQHIIGKPIKMLENGYYERMIVGLGPVSKKLFGRPRIKQTGKEGTSQKLSADNNKMEPFLHEENITKELMTQEKGSKLYLNGKGSKIQRVIEEELQGVLLDMFPF